MRLAGIAVAVLATIAARAVGGQLAPPRGSGTTWLPHGTADVHAAHRAVAEGWRLGAHGLGFAQMVRQGGTRGHWQFGSTNWLMGTAERRTLGGQVMLRGMLSAEPLTLTRMGYPQLLQEAQPYKGALLTDRQHPHELFSELAASYEREVSPGIGLSLYLAPSGEPAAGPVAFMHRPSAAHDPIAPLGHHLQDGLHTAFGVITAGVFTSRLRLEGSTFNGAHPDELRTGLDYQGARLDSWAGRFTINSAESWSASAWVVHVANRVDESAEHGAHVIGARRRVGGSVLHTQRGARKTWSSAVIYVNDRAVDGDETRDSFLVESDLEVAGRHAFFTRAERVTRTAAELALVGSVPRTLDVSAISVGYGRTLAAVRGIQAVAGARGTINIVPNVLRPFYGSFTPLGGVVFLRLSGGAP